MDPLQNEPRPSFETRMRYLDENATRDEFREKSFYLSDENYRRRAERELERLKKEKPKTRQTAYDIEKKLRKLDKEAGLWTELLQTPLGDGYRPPMTTQESRAVEYRDSMLRDAEARIADAQRELANQLERLEDAQFRAAAPAAPVAAAPAVTAPAETPKRKPRAPAAAGPAEAGPAEAGPADKPKRKPRAAAGAAADGDKPKRKPRAPKPVDRDALQGKMTKSGGFRTTVYKDATPAHPKRAYVSKAVDSKAVRVAQNEEKPRAKKVAYAGTRSNFAKWFGL